MIEASGVTIACQNRLCRISGDRNRPIPAAATPRISGSRSITSLQTWRSTIIFLIDAIALAGFRLFGQVLVQFMIVWQR